jgi:hypothetical protein
MVIGEDNLQYALMIFEHFDGAMVIQDGVVNSMQILCRINVPNYNSSREVLRLGDNVQARSTASRHSHLQ